MLSTLWVFAKLTSGREMAKGAQDAVLHVLYLLTRFPPAVRAMHILMRGETPRLSERAALSRCIYEIVKDVVPVVVIKSEPTRFLEGSRLLFGLILDKAKHLKLLPTDKDAILPYANMKVYDLRSTVTMKPVRGISVQTQDGLTDAGAYQAFTNDGPLIWIKKEGSIKTSTPDKQWARTAILSGGTQSKVVAFNADTATFCLRYADKGDINEIIAKAEYSNLQYLANLCSRTGLGVSPPSALHSTIPPVLTLDRWGYLAVYIGREGCGGVAGRDTLMFRPLTGEESVDTSVITQLLVPILSSRKADGTAIFEAFGDHHRPLKSPTEAIMFCVDLSTSMDSECDFLGTKTHKGSEPLVNPRSHAGLARSVDSLVEDMGAERLALDELKGA